MSETSLDAESFSIPTLVIDAGSVTTRAALFDVVGDRYRYLGTGTAPAGRSSGNDLMSGVRKALEELGEITGHAIELAPGSNQTGDAIAATFSGGPELKILLIGLLENVSVESARRLTFTTGCQIVDTIQLGDTRRPEELIASILRLRPDLVIAAGGIDHGASVSLMEILESFRLACHALPEEARPRLLFVGNQSLLDDVNDRFQSLITVDYAPNIRPSLDLEQLGPAHIKLARIIKEIHQKQIPGLTELDQWTKGTLQPSAIGFGRIIRFLSKDKNQATVKGVLGIDIGSSATTLAAAYDGQLILRVFPELGQAAKQYSNLDEYTTGQISKWLSMPIPDGYLNEYLTNKQLYPTNLPVTLEDLAIEQAIARYALQTAVTQALLTNPSFNLGTTVPQPVELSFRSLRQPLLPWFEPIIATGSVLTKSPSLAQTMLMLLDGLQPTGITTIVLDPNQILSGIGVAAERNPTLAVQILDSNALLPLATVITPIGYSRPGTPILRLKMMDSDDGTVTPQRSRNDQTTKPLTTRDIKQGTLEVIPLPPGQTAQIQIQPLHRYEVGMGGIGRGGALKVTGSALGIVIDARGRPLNLPKDPQRRYELFSKWLWTLKG